MLEKTRIRTYECVLLAEEADEFSIANILTSNWGRFKGPPSASEWTFGSAGRSNAVKIWKLTTKGQHARNIKIKLGQGSMQHKM